MCKINKMCSFHRFTRNVEIALLCFSCQWSIHKSCRICQRQLFVTQYLMAFSRHHCAVAIYKHLSPEIADICSPSSSSWKYIPRKLNCSMKIVELESILAGFLSSLWLSNWSLENLWTISKFPHQKFQWKLFTYSIFCD